MMDSDGGAFDRTRQPTRGHLQEVLRRVSGTGVTLSDVHRVSSCTDRAMQTTAYRLGRVLLAGDAAHTHSPYGLLDAYTRERLPIGAWVLDWTRAQAAAMRPDPHGQAVQALIRDLLGTRDGTSHVYEKVSGTSIRYDLGGEHPLIGRNAPDFRLGDGARLGELLQDGRGVALDFSTDHRLREPAASRRSRLRYAAGTAKNDLGLGAVLVRPDGIVAWAGDRDFVRSAFERSADRWFGDPGTWAPVFQGAHMTITLRPGTTVMFTGDSITDSQRLESEDGLGFGYPLRIAGEWGFRHPDRPVIWLNSGIGGHKVMDLGSRWQADVLDARPDVVSILAGVNDTPTSPGRPHVRRIRRDDRTGTLGRGRRAPDAGRSCRTRGGLAAPGRVTVSLRAGAYG